MHKQNKSRKNVKQQDKAAEAARSFAPASSLKADPQGSYTGKGQQPGERPTQDADDL